jgi:hypothetical protein
MQNAPRKPTLIESELLARRGHTTAFDFAEIGTIR